MKLRILALCLVVLASGAVSCHKRKRSTVVQTVGNALCVPLSGLFDYNLDPDGKGLTPPNQNYNMSWVYYDSDGNAVILVRTEDNGGPNRHLFACYFDAVTRVLAGPVELAGSDGPLTSLATDQPSQPIVMFDRVPGSPNAGDAHIVWAQRETGSGNELLWVSVFDRSAWAAAPAVAPFGFDATAFTVGVATADAGCYAWVSDGLDRQARWFGSPVANTYSADYNGTLSRNDKTASVFTSYLALVYIDITTGVANEVAWSVLDHDGASPAGAAQWSPESGIAVPAAAGSNGTTVDQPAASQPALVTYNNHLFFGGLDNLNDAGTETDRLVCWAGLNVPTLSFSATATEVSVAHSDDAADAANEVNTLMFAQIDVLGPEDGVPQVLFAMERVLGAARDFYVAQVAGTPPSFDTADRVQLTADAPGTGTNTAGAVQMRRSRNGDYYGIGYQTGTGLFYREYATSDALSTAPTLTPPAGAPALRIDNSTTAVISWRFQEDRPSDADRISVVYAFTDGGGATTFGYNRVTRGATPATLAGIAGGGALDVGEFPGATSTPGQVALLDDGASGAVVYFLESDGSIVRLVANRFSSSAGTMLGGETIDNGLAVTGMAVLANDDGAVHHVIMHTDYSAIDGTQVPRHRRYNKAAGISTATLTNAAVFDPDLGVTATDPSPFGPTFSNDTNGPYLLRTDEDLDVFFGFSYESWVNRFHNADGTWCEPIPLDPQFDGPGYTRVVARLGRNGTPTIYLEGIFDEGASRTYMRVID